MKGKAFLVVAAVGVSAVLAQGAVIFSDDFETGNLSKWTTTGTSPLAIDGTKNVVPAGGTYSAVMDNSLDRMHHNIIADNGGVELNGPSTATWWIFDEASTTATRNFSEVRGYSGGTGLPNGGTAASGALAQLIAAGKYNSVTMAGEVYAGTKYQARVTFGTTTGWFNLNGPGSPNRSPGWHRFDVERLADGTTLNFYVDTILSRTITGATAQSWDTAILGPGLGSTVGNAWIDGYEITNTLVPEPATIALLAAGGLLFRRRRMA